MRNFSDPHLEFDSDYEVRCPKCLEIWHPEGCDEPVLYEDGEHKTDCPECGHEFTVQTCVSISWTSPPKVVETGEVPRG